MAIPKELHDLMALQGEIKIKLMADVSEAMADDLAAELLHLIAESPVVTTQHRDAYKRLSPPSS